MEPDPEPVLFESLKIDHPCAHCGDNFVNEIALISHQIYERFCLECNTSFKDIDIYQQHRMYVHPSTDSCTFCRQLVSSRMKLIQHLRAHTNLPLRAPESIHSEIFRCRNCSEVFKLKCDYVKHNLDHHFLNKKICPLCSDSFGSHREMSVHCKVHLRSRKQALQTKPVKVPQKTRKPSAAPPIEKARGRGRPVKKSILQKPGPAKESKKNQPAPATQASRKNQSATSQVTGKGKTTKATLLTPAQESAKTKPVKTQPPLLKRRSLGLPDTITEPTPDANPTPAVIVTLKGNRCSACRESVSSLSIFYEHVLNLHFKNPLQCPFCEKNFKHPKHTSLHLRYHKKIFYQPEPSQSATSSHTKSSSASASTSRAKVPNKGAIPKQSLVHVVQEALSDPMLCPVCGQKFLTRVTLDKHIRCTHHIEPAK